MVSLVYLVLMAITCIFGPLLAPNDPTTIHADYTRVPPSLAAYPKADAVEAALKDALRRARLEREREFAPHALGHEGVHLAVTDHLRHERHRLVRHAEAQRREARGEARDAQDPHRVLDEGRRDMAESLRRQVAFAPVGVDEPAGGVARHGVDRQVAPLEVVLERHRRGEFHLEAAVAGRDLALEPRQRIFLVRLRVQEHREFLADGPVARALHLLRRRAHDHPVALAHRQAQQAITYRTTHEVDFHARMLTERRSHTAAAGPAICAGWRGRFAAMGMLSLLAGCSPGYLLQAAGGQWRLMRARVPITQVLEDRGTDASLRARLALVRDARDYASRELGLPDNGSYRSYAALGRPYAVWNVVAAPEFSVQPRHWCFPFTGCVSYRGYFREERARRYAARLAARGDDTLVAGVSAYSTLGHFADPLLDTMLRQDDATLVGTIFHELAHQLVYVRGETAFNEAFAMSVERAGLSRWLAARGEEAALERYAEESAKNPKWKKIYDNYTAFQREQILWFRVCENTYDNYMATVGSLTAAPAKK